MSFIDKRNELLCMDDRALISRILAFPDKQRLNYDKSGKRRRFPSGEMAANALRSMEKNPEWKMSDRQKFAMADSFARFSTDELRVSGILSFNTDLRTLIKNETGRDGAKSMYSMKFHLVPEPENGQDKSTVAVYADNMDGGRTKIGYLPASYVKAYPVLSPMDVDGTLTDFSNGKFRNISYAMSMEVGIIARELSTDTNPDMFTYKMKFSLNNSCREDTAQYLNEQCDWTVRLNRKLKAYDPKARVSNVRFEINCTSGNVVIESYSSLGTKARRACNNYFRYILGTKIFKDLKNNGYVDVAQGISAVNVKEDARFILYGRPAARDVPITIDQLLEKERSGEEVWFHYEQNGRIYGNRKGIVVSVTDDGMYADIRDRSLSMRVEKCPVIKEIPISDIYMSQGDLYRASRMHKNEQS